MAKSTKNQMRTLLTVVVIVAGFLAAGCSSFEAPTASEPTTGSAMGLWNPQAGDKIGGGATPLVNSTYWESLYGAQINPASYSVSTWIGPNGGTLRLGPNRIDVPAGAVDSYVNFSMTYGSMTGIAVDCSPSPMTFNVPVRLTLSFWGTQYDHGRDGNNPADLRVYYMPPEGSVEELPTEVDPQGLVVRANVNHFSRYIIGARLTF
jgi:hypothetical protein